MPIITARHTLQAMWPIVYQATSRELNDSECSELRRLCDVLTSIVFPAPEFHDASRHFCESLHSSRVFVTGKIEEPDKLLDRIDKLREILGN